MLPEKTPFCLDKIYPPGTLQVNSSKLCLPEFGIDFVFVCLLKQEAIYEDVGKEMVNDVM